jgi:hypothetical protein
VGSEPRLEQALRKIRSFRGLDNVPETQGISNGISAPETVPKTKGFGSAETIPKRKVSGTVSDRPIPSVSRTVPILPPKPLVSGTVSGSQKQRVSVLQKPLPILFFFGNGFGVPETISIGNGLGVPEA